MVPAVSPGEPFPLGATFDGLGTNFSVFSQAAEAVELCLFDETDARPVTRCPRSTPTAGTATSRGRARAAATGTGSTGPTSPRPACAATPPSCCSTPTPRRSTARSSGARPPTPTTAGADDLRIDTSDSAASMPKAIVVDPAFDWGADRPPRTRWADTVIYETHVKGLTWSHPDIPDHQRGTYAAVAHPAMIEHFTRLGITAVELMPVHHFVHDDRLVQLGLRNYWGYNSIAYLAPYNGYSSRGGHRVVNEFKAMVRALHEARIEVILDVVYNHTAEGDHLGPDAGVPGHRQRQLLPAGRRPAPLLQRLHRNRQLPQRAQPARAAADDGLAALLGAGDARRRLPLRPGRQPGPPVPRGRPAVGLLRPHPAGPGDQPGQAHRRALGRRRRRLPGRQLPAAVVGVERQVPRHGPRLLAPGRGARSATWPSA